jgi:hypothetical protein
MFTFREINITTSWDILQDDEITHRLKVESMLLWW